MDDNTYSHLVSWLKIVLPLLALAILSTLFLVARTVDPAQNLPFADVDVDEIARDQRIGKPNYSGVTSDGAAVSVVAESAKPDPDRPDAMTGEKAEAVIELENGITVNVTAGALDLDNAAGQVRLLQDVHVTTSDGYSIETEEVQVALNRTRIASDRHSVVKGPVGVISADTFELTRESASDPHYLLVFKGHVKLVYRGEE